MGVGENEGIMRVIDVWERCDDEEGKLVSKQADRATEGERAYKR